MIVGCQNFQPENHLYKYYKNLVPDVENLFRVAKLIAKRHVAGNLFP